MQLFTQQRSVYDKCHGRAHLLDQVWHQNRFRRETECGKFGLDYHPFNKSVVLCVLCAALPARPGFPSGRADLYEEEHGKNIRMHVYTYALR